MVSSMRFRLFQARCGLLTSYVCVQGLADGRYHPRRTSYFDASYNYMFGVQLHEASSVLFSELYANFFAVKYIIREGIADLGIFTDSRSALVCVRGGFIDLSNPYIVHSIARLLLPAITRTCCFFQVHFSWIPAHSSILGNEIADRIARTAAGLPFAICFGLPCKDLLNDMWRDFLAWICILWPYQGSRHNGFE